MAPGRVLPRLTTFSVVKSGSSYTLAVPKDETSGVFIESAWALILMSGSSISDFV